MKKSIVCHDCEIHTILYHDNMMVDDFIKGTEPSLTSYSLSRSDKIRKESEGKEEAAAVGCNANNSNVGRTLNCNNSVSNANSNYAGGFAHIKVKEEHLSSQPSRLNKTDKRIDIVGYAQADYESLPFMDNNGLERNADNAARSIWDELHFANTKRNLKRLKCFYLSHEIAVYAVKRACRSRSTKAKVYYYEHADEIADKLIDDIKNGMYEVKGFKTIDLPKAHKTSKQRHAKIFSLYDRCMQMFCLTIIEQKLKRKVLRNNYSNIENRGILCNNKQYCMLNQIRTASWKYKDLWVLNTDIKKFYESVKWKMVVEVLFRTVKDETSRMIIYKTFEAAQDLPIGCCLSPLAADILMNDYDEIILKDFKPRFYAAFGDNRLYVGRKDILQKILSFTRKYYRNHYHLKLKNDYQIRKVSDGFTFCKTFYKMGYAKINGEMRRRAIKSALSPRSYAGYNGILQKTDSKHLSYLIKNRLFKLRCGRNVNNVLKKLEIY